MVENFVIDTNALIRYFDTVFGSQSFGLSKNARAIIQDAFTDNSLIRLSIPSVVFLEIFEKWYKDEEFSAKFRYEIYERIRSSPNIEVRPIDREILEKLIEIRGSLTNHDIHDKIILASAIALECPLITFDKKIIDYIKASTIISSLN
jgi:predicted nucleic acid-binding protein